MATVKYLNKEFVRCINRTEDNHEKLILEKVYQIVGMNQVENDIVYAIKDECGNLYYSIDRFELAKGGFPVVVDVPESIDGSKLVLERPKFGEFSNEDRFKMLQHEMLETYMAKNKDYGNSVARTYDAYGMVSFATRIADKYNRIENLIVNGKAEVKSESMRDTVMDLSVYSMLWLMIMDADKEVTTVYANEMESNATQRPITDAQRHFITGLSIKLGLNRADLPSYVSPLPNYKELTEAEGIQVIDRLVSIKAHMDKMK